MKAHDLKTHPAPFRAVWDGIKLFEVRVNDRGFEVGDLLYLHEWRPETHKRGAYYTDRRVLARVTYMLHGGQYGLPKELCVMGFTIVNRVGE